MSEIKLSPIENEGRMGKDPIGKLVHKLGILGMNVRRDDVICQNENEVCLLIEFRKKKAEKMKQKAMRNFDVTASSK